MGRSCPLRCHPAPAVGREERATIRAATQVSATENTVTMSANVIAAMMLSMRSRVVSAAASQTAQRTAAEVDVRRHPGCQDHGQGEEHPADHEHDDTHASSS